ncbi:universal stress protein [Pleurocapsales cyanobacterium LEGE 10410]|nr:universal stress protein [Pleurocapsales cyanobacterium LEGE 10410]
MFNKILVAIDLSAASRQVFDQALTLAKATGVNLILLHVLSEEEEGAPIMSSYFTYSLDRCIHLDPQIMRQANMVYEKEWELFKQKGLELLRFYTSRAIAAGVQAEFSQITGEPSTTICDFAESCDADIAIVGRRGHSSLQELLLGSVSNYVVHHAPCSVLLVQTPAIERASSGKELETTKVYA